MRPSRKSMAALVAAAFALVMATGTPASADPAVANIVGGTITVTQDGDDIVFDFDDPNGNGPCPNGNGDPSFDMTIDKSGVPYQTEVTGANIDKAIFQDVNTGNWYQIELAVPGIFANDGEIDPTYDAWNFQNVFLTANILQLAEDNGVPICDKGQAVAECNVGVQLELEGSYDPGPPQTGVLDSQNPAGDNILVGTPCDPAIQNQVQGEQVIVDGLEIEIKK